MIERTGCVTVKRLKEILDTLDPDYVLATNRVGNLNIYHQTDEPDPCFTTIGYIELANVDYWSKYSRDKDEHVEVTYWGFSDNE